MAPKRSAKGNTTRTKPAGSSNCSAVRRSARARGASVTKGASTIEEKSKEAMSKVMVPSTPTRPRRATETAVDAANSQSKANISVPLNHTSTGPHADGTGSVGKFNSDPGPEVEPLDLARDGWGSKWQARDDWMSKQQAATMLKAGMIDQAQADRLALPWKEKQDLKVPLWDEKYIDPKVKENWDFEIMPLKEALKIQAKKDKAEKKFLDDWRAGKIDENGNPIARVSAKNTKTSTSSVPEEEQEHGEDSEMSDSDKEDGIPVPPKPTAKKVYGAKGKLSKAPLPTIEEVPSAKGATTSPVESSSLSSIPSDLSDMSTPSAPVVVRNVSKATKATTSKSAKATTSKPAKLTKSKSTKANETKSAPAPAPQPLNGAVDYSQWGYYQLAALCRERGLISGGNVAIIRARLMADDVAVRDGTPRQDLCKYNRGTDTKPKREYKHTAPVTPAKPPAKRKRDDDDDKDEGADVVTKKNKVAK